MQLAKCIIVPLSALLLSSCFTSVPEELPPQEVLRRTIINTITLDTVAMQATVLVTGTDDPPLRILLALTGTLAPWKHAWMIDVDGAGMLTVDKPISTRFRVASRQGGSVYLRIDNLQSPATELWRASSGSMIGQWLLLASGSALPPSPSSPDPRLIEAYASAIEVVRGGLEQESNGSYVYRYDVRISPAALATLQKSDVFKQVTIIGNLTIDATSFILSRASWTLSSVPSALGLVDATVSVRFHDHNVAQLSLPVLTGSDLQIESIFDMISSY